MFRLIEAIDYRCLKEVRQPLNRFEILVGANASGKSTFLDVLGFLSDFVSEGLGAAVDRRTSNFHDLVWGRSAASFYLSVEAQLPQALQKNARVNVRYDVEFLLDTRYEKLRVKSESVSGPERPKRSIMRRSGDFANFFSEVDGQDEWSREDLAASSALNALPNVSFRMTAWLRRLLRDGIRTVALQAGALSEPSPPGSIDVKRIDGSSLARLVSQLKSDDSERFQDWLAHVRTALPDVRDIDSILRPEDRHRYIMVQYENGVQVPSWMVSEGTLRLLALTILAYLPDFKGVYLIEEPENGVHPTALETIYQSLSSVYDAQVLVASHSPILLNMASPEQILVFSKTAEGAKIVRGSEHPALQDWRKEVSLGTLAASGILG